MEDCSLLSKSIKKISRVTFTGGINQPSEITHPN